MADRSAIQWTDATWNPVRGCSRVSAGCQNCYAERQAIRQIDSGYKGLIKRTIHGPAWTGEVCLIPELLDQPLRWAKPRRIFANSMSDFFHEGMPFAAMATVFAYMARAHWHSFQVLTKRAARMQALLSSDDFVELVDSYGHAAQDDAERILGHRGEFDPNGRRRGDIRGMDFTPPLRNVHLGVSVENQETADERIPLLLQTPAAVRFVSYEPALGPVKFGDWLSGNITRLGIDWLIVGGESGPGARPCDIDWIRSAMQQCKAAGVPVFVKQVGTFVIDRNDAGFGDCEPGSWPLRPDGCDPAIDDDPFGYVERWQGASVRVRTVDRKGGDPREWPEDLRVREFPR